MTKAELITLLLAYAAKYGIDPNIAVAQIDQESRFNPNAVSPAGARGIAQFMPATAARFGVTNPFDPNQALEGWGKYMSWLLRRFGGNYSFALAGYNAGEGNVDKYGGVPPFTETRNYVRIILDAAGRTGYSAGQQLGGAGSIGSAASGIFGSISSAASGVFGSLPAGAPVDLTLVAAAVAAFVVIVVAASGSRRGRR